MMGPKLNSIGFDANFVRSLKSRWNEGAFVDFKSEPYILDSDKNKEKFSRHIIAFSNVARRTGKSCYMVFGVDKDQYNWVSVWEKYALRDSKFQNNPHISIHVKQNDGVLEVYRNVLESFIVPVIPEIYLHYGSVDDVFVSYLEICPTNTSIAFRSKKKIGNHPPLTTFVRLGSSSVPLPNSEAERLCSQNDMEYLQPQEWTNLIRYHLSGDFISASSLEPIFEQSEIHTGKKVVDVVFNLILERKQSIVLVGDAGIGKTTLLQKIAYNLSRLHTLETFDNFPEFGTDVEHDEEIAVSLQDIELIPVIWIPLYLEFRKISTFYSVNEIDIYCQRQIERILGRSIGSIKKLLGIPSTKWVFLLDGIDEIHNRELCIPILREWLQLLPLNVQAILTSRPYSIGENLAERQIFIAPLNNEEIGFLIKGIFASAEENTLLADKLIQALDRTEYAYDLLRRPRAILGLAKFYANYHPIKPSLDGDYVKLEKPLSESITFSNHTNDEKSLVNGKIPIIGQDILSDGSIDFEYSRDEKDETEKDDFFDFKLAIAVRVILQYLQDEEVKRQHETQKAERDAHLATFELEKIAWQKLDWDQLIFKETKSIGKSILWALFIGFVEQKQYPFCKFSNELLRCYFAASFGFDKEDDERKIHQMFQKNAKKRFSHQIKILLNELRLSHGNKTLIS